MTTKIWLVINGLLLSAIVLCGVMFWLYGRRMADLQKTVESKDAELGRSSYFIGAFPENMPWINKFLVKTRYSLQIWSDHCAYGNFSNPEQYAEYSSTIKQLKQKNVTITIHIYESKTADAMTKSQFNLTKAGDSAEFRALVKSNRFKKYFEYNNQHKTPKTVPKTVEEFVSLMNNDEEACISELSEQGISIEQDVSSPLPLFTWVQDDDEAIFSMYNLGPDAREVSLYTKDKQLVNLLKSIRH